MTLGQGTGSSGVWQLFKERASRGALYGASSYWDARAGARTGLARSLWPSNAFNAVWSERQKELIVRSLGSLQGRRVVDVGCGTGRIVRWLAEECGSREAVGLDFSQATVDVARLESSAQVASRVARFEQADVLAGFDTLHLGEFDDAIVLGCLSVACSDADALSTALRNVAHLVRPGGRVLLLEPIHRSRLLRRVLDLGVEEWIALANGQGLVLESADRMGFVPIRLVMSVREAPKEWVEPVFRVGERLLDAAPWLSSLADYKLLLFARQA